MGIILGPIYIGGIFLYFMLYKSMRKKGKSFISSLLLIFIATLPFTYDIAITNALTLYHCKIDSSYPKTQILKKVEYPMSIYWEDNVYPGFSKKDRAFMIINNLEGKHLKTMALNAPDGKIYVYHLEEPLWDKFNEKHKELKGMELDKAYAKEIMKRETVYTKNTMPKMNYTVVFNKVKLNKFSDKFFHSDESKIIDNKTDEIIAFNRRYMRFFYNIEPKFLGNDLNYYYKEDAMCGDWYAFHLKVFEMLKWRPKGFNEHELNLNEQLNIRKGK